MPEEMKQAIERFREADPFRMISWLIAALVLYGASRIVGNDDPQTQVTLYKYAHVTGLAWVGYWIARTALGRVDYMSDQDELQARALIMAGAMLAGSLGL